MSERDPALTPIQRFSPPFFFFQAFEKPLHLLFENRLQPFPLQDSPVVIKTREELAAIMREEVDEVICAATPEPFWAVGAWYGDFSQTSDEEVRAAKLATERASKNWPNKNW